jgi:hypothetical protein
VGEEGQPRTRPIPRIDPLSGQPADRVLWLHESGLPRWTYDPDRRSGDVVPEVIKVLLSELRPTRGEYERPSVSGKHRAPRRRWWEGGRPPSGGLQMRYAG